MTAAREVVGTIEDPHSGEPAEVRQGKRGLYYVTAWGPVNLRGKGFEDWIRSRMNPAPPPDETPPDPPAPKAAPSPAPNPPRRRTVVEGLLDWLNGA